MSSFRPGMSSQCLRKFWESKGRAAIGRPANPPLHRFRHLCANGAEIEEKGFQQSWIVGRPNGIEAGACLKPLPRWSQKLVVRFQGRRRIHVSFSPFLWLLRTFHLLRSELLPNKRNCAATLVSL